MEAKSFRKVRTKTTECQMGEPCRPKMLISIMVKQRLRRLWEKLTIGCPAIIVGENLTKRLQKDTFLIAEKRARIFEELQDEDDCKKPDKKYP